MRIPRLQIAVGLLVLALAAPGVAQAQEEDAPLITPPGNSAVEQYRETLPAPGGNRTRGEDGERSPSQVLGERNAERLESFGEDGEAAAELAAESSPAGTVVIGETVVEKRRAAGKGPGGAGPNGGLAGADPTTSALAQIAGQATGADADGGIGWLLPLIVALAVVGGIAYAAGRRRARDTAR